jgi:dCTP deaminase
MIEAHRSALAFEFIERCVRLYDHVDRSCAHAILPGTRPTVQVTIGDELKGHLFELLEQAIGFYSSKADLERFKTYFKNRLEHLASVHIYGLARIPRAREPIEIVSYLRQTSFAALSQDQAVKFGNVRIFATELLGNGTHANFDLINAKRILEAKDSPASVADLAETLLAETPSEHRSPLISLPRVDLNAPASWPCLFHEIAHIDVSIDDVWANFTKNVADSQRALAREAVAAYAVAEDHADVTAELRGWLLECWCDAFAVVCAGPAIFFSQLHSFAFSAPGYLEQHVRRGLKYPPAWFRLKLILAFSEARLDGAHEETRRFVCKAMEDEKKLITELFGHKAVYDSNLDTLLTIFKEFIRAAFPRESYSLAGQISSANLKQLVNDLADGLPIPSLSATIDGGPQRAASSSEILLAGWIYRCTKFRNNIGRILDQTTGSTNGEVAGYLIAQVKRADEALKRSIQMAEWFAILNDAAISKTGDGSNIVAATEPVNIDSPGVLSDRDLNTLMANDTLRIVPLIDAKFQVRGTVIDLRLGHNFEIFPSSVPRIVDPMVSDDRQSSDSLEVDVDFGQGLNIGPGQFLLAHTLEYIKLPSNVAAQVEGRSSFARIGLQVHMTANLVEAGFDGCLTLEVVNNGPSSIRLYPGMRIAQLRFFRLANTPQYPYGVSGENKYSGRLSHNKTQQFSDWETNAINEAKIRFGIRGKDDY